MGPVLHAIMHEQAQRRRAAKAKPEQPQPSRHLKERDMINLNGQPKSEEEVFKEQMAFVMMSKEAQKEADAKKAAAAAQKTEAASASPTPEQSSVDVLEELERSPRISRHRGKSESPEPRKPYKQPGPGFLLKLAHWLNLK